jgi:outer membrane protein, heavy metal efflux system
MRIPTPYVVLALLSLGAPATAQTVLTEADALARLSAESPRVRAIRATTEIARAEALAAARWPNPRGTFNREAVAGVTENIITVSQVLPITGRRGLEVSAASALVTATERRADDAIRQARAELRRAYADLVAAQARERELTQARERVREVAEVLARREAAGDAAGYDRLRAEREVMDLDTEISNARVDRTRAQGSVAAFFNPAPPDIVAAAPSLAAAAPLPPLDALLELARSVRGERAALQQEINSARFAERAAARRMVPEPEVVAGTKSSNAAGGDVGSVISVHASIPLFDRAQPERALARARIAQAEAQALVFDSALAAQIAAARAVVAERRDAADRYRASAGSAADLERIARVSYDAGERGILELLDAYRSGAAVRQRQAVLDASVRQAEIELAFVSGWEIP